jgi:hypothetical protein
MPTQDLRCFIVAILGNLFLVGGPLDVVLHAAPIPVRYSQGSQHGFLALRTPEGTRIATGYVTQDVHGDIVTSQLPSISAMDRWMKKRRYFLNEGFFAFSVTITSSAGHPSPSKLTL